MHTCMHSCSARPMACACACARACRFHTSASSDLVVHPGSGLAGRVQELPAGQLLLYTELIETRQVPARAGLCICARHACMHADMNARVHTAQYICTRLCASWQPSFGSKPPQRRASKLQLSASAPRALLRRMGLTASDVLPCCCWLRVAGVPSSLGSRPSGRCPCCCWLRGGSTRTRC